MWDMELDWYFWAKELYREYDNSLATGDVDDIPKARWHYLDDKIQYNQRTQGYKSWCVIFAGIGCMSDQLGEEFEQADIDSIMKLAKDKYGREDWEWMYVSYWADCICEWWNSKYPTDRIYKYTVDTGSEAELQLMKKWYTIHNGFRANSNYWTDIKDCTLDTTKYTATTFGHSIRKWYNRNDWKIYTTENYEWTAKCNVYSIKEYQNAVKNWFYFTKSFVYIFKNPIMTQILPTHPDYSFFDPEDVETVKGWEDIMSRYLPKGYTPRFDNYNVWSKYNILSKMNTDKASIKLKLDNGEM